MVVGTTWNGTRINLFFFRFPSVINHQGEETRKLSEERGRQWLANINRADFDGKKADHSRVCSHHFISGNNMQCIYRDFLVVHRVAINSLRKKQSVLGANAKHRPRKCLNCIRSPFKSQGAWRKKRTSGRSKGIGKPTLWWATWSCYTHWKNKK